MITLLLSLRPRYILEQGLFSHIRYKMHHVMGHLGAKTATSADALRLRG
jgi:hypothetical protein